MAEITVTEGDNSKADFTLTYSQSWSDSTKRGLPVLKADTTKVFFYVAKTITGTPWLTLSDASASQIQWLDTANGKIRVFFNGNQGTSTQIGDGQFYELRLKMADGTYVSVESGKFNVLNSVVDQA